MNMFSWLGRRVALHPRRVIIAWCAIALFFVVAAGTGFGQGSIFSRLGTSDFSVPGSQSARVTDIQKAAHDYQIVSVISGTTADAADGEKASAIQAKIKKLPGVSSVIIPPAVTYDALEEASKQANAAVDKELEQAATTAQQQAANAVAELVARGVPETLATQQVQEQMASAQAGQPSESQVRNTAVAQAREQARTTATNQLASFLSEDGYVIAITMSDGATQKSNEATILQLLNDGRDALAPQGTLTSTSSDLALESVNGVARADLVTGESIGLPVALILMVIVFGGFLAALMPFAGAILAIFTAAGCLWVGTFAATIDSLILNVISIIGIALSIDYGLLVVSRYREELRASLTARGITIGPRGTPTPAGFRDAQIEAITTTVATAGRTVVFSAVTIAAALCGLLVIRVPLLRVISIGAVIIALLAVCAATTAVPAILMLLGARIARPSMLKRIPGFQADVGTSHGAFSTIARAVQRIPWLTMLIILALLGLFMVPLGQANMRVDTSEVLPDTASINTVTRTLNTSYPDLASPHITVMTKQNAAAEAAWLKTLDGVTNVSEPVAREDGWYSIAVRTSSSDAVGQQVVDTVQQIRHHSNVLVGGGAAMQLDFNTALEGGAWGALAIIVVAVFVLLFLMTGSLVVPLKAVIINTISLVASLGFTAWLFEHGYLGLPQLSGMATYIVALCLAFGFGLSMDYEVFLVTRMKEFWDAGYSNNHSVQRGLQASGRIITSAAAIIIAVFIGFVFGDMLPIRQLGVMLAVTVFFDATLVRMLLVPATMTVLGRWNWWAPRWLERAYLKLGLSERQPRFAQDAKDARTIDHLTSADVTTLR